MKKILLFTQVIILVVFTQQSVAQQIMKEDFEIATGLQGWRHTRGNPNMIVTPGGLTYSGYPGAGSASLVLSGSGEETGVTHSASYAPAPSIYTSFMLQVTNASANDDLVMNYIGTTAMPLNDYGFVVQNNGGLKFGLKVNGTATYGAATYTLGTTYLIVVKYNTSSKIYSLFVNPGFVSEPGATLSSAAHPGTSATYVSQIQFNQRTGLDAKVAGVRVVGSWTDISSLPPKLLVSESFAGGGTLLSDYGWSSTLCCTNAFEVDNPGLIYAGASFPVGDAVYDQPGSGMFTKSFPTVSSGIIYASFLVDNVTSQANNTMANINFYSSSQTNWNTNQGFVLNGTNASLKNGDLSTNLVAGSSSSATRFIVLGYNIGTGQYSLWINPALGSTTAPGATITATSSVITSVEGISLINPNVGSFIYDEIRVSTTWADVVRSTASDPTEASALVMNSVTSTNANGTVTPATGSISDYLVVRGTDIPPTFKPNDGSSYSPGNVGGDRIVSAGSIFVNDNSIDPETTYFYKVYAYDPITKNYNQNFPAQDIISTGTTESPSFSLTSATETSATFSMGVLNDAEGKIVVRSFDPFAPFASDGRSYFAGNTFNEGSTVTVAYAGNASTFTDIGLAPGTRYNYKIYSTTGISTYTNLNENYEQLSVSTLKAEPPTQPAAITFLQRTDNSIEYQVTLSGNEDGFMVLYRAGTSPTSVPVDGFKYTEGSTFGSDRVGYFGSAGSVSHHLSSLQENTLYFVDVYAYSYTVSSNYYNYRQLNPLEGSAFTIEDRPTQSATSFVFAATTNTSLTATFNVNPAIEGALVIRRSSGTQDFFPEDGRGYAINEVVGFSLTSVIVSNVSKTGFTDAGLAPGTLYYYDTYTYNGTGLTSAYNFSKTTNSRTTAPANPVAGLAVAITQTSFDATWTNPPTSSSYKIDVSLSNTFATFVPPYTDLTVAVPNTTVTGLTAGTPYFYRVRAVSATGTSDNSNVVSMLTTPPNPVATAASIPTTQTSFTANWNAATSASSYILDVSTSNAFTTFVYQDVNVGNVLTYNVTALPSAGTTYYYRVRASNGTTSGNSNTISIVNAPVNPVATAATVMTTSSFNANWTTVPTATGYQLDVSLVNNFLSFVPGYNSLAVAGGSTITQAVTGLTGGLTYYYRVRAVNATGTSGNSGTISLVTPPPAPVASAATSISTTTFSANWAASPTATSYKLDVATTNTFIGGTFVAGFQDVALGNVITAPVSGLTAGVTYYYRVRGVSTSGTSTDSNVISVVTAPPAPVPSAATAITQTTFNANWAAAATATGYRIDVSTDPAFGSFVGAYNNFSADNVTTLAVSPVSSGTTYYYRVRATSGSGTSNNSTSISLTTTSPVASAPSSILQTSFAANWAATTGATGYMLDVATDAGFTSFVPGYNNKSVGNVLTSAVNTNISAGTTYYYRMRVVSASGTSGNSNTISLITVPGNPVANAATALAQTSFSANWDAVAGAASYRLDVASTSGFTGTFITGYQDLNVGNVTTFSVNTNLTAGTTFYYRVRAVNVSGASSSSNVTTVLTTPPASVATAATGGDQTSFVAHWNTTLSATSYVIDVSSDGFNTFTGSYNNFNIGNVLLTSVTGLSGGIDYSYRIRAVNASGASSNSNVIHQITTPNAPVAIAPGGITTSSFVANWDVTTGATSYRLDVSVDDFATFVSGFNNLTVSSGTQATVGGLAEGVTYKYRVRAVNGTGTSGNSNTISVLTVPPVPTATAATGITETSFTATWTSVDGATEYLLDVSLNDFTTFLTGYNGKSISSTSELLSGLSPNTTYKYRLRATSSSGTSGNSNVITTVTYATAPVASAATSMTQTGFTANWDPKAGITSFQLDVSLDNFVTTVPGFNALVVTGTSQNVTGLTSGTNYKFRLRAVNAAGPSVNSNVISTITVPGTPMAAAASDLNDAGFTANWNNVTGADSYLLDVSITSDFTTFLPGYSAKVITTNSEVITGLSSGTIYYYRVSAVNASDGSPKSNVIAQITKPGKPLANSVEIKGDENFIASWDAVPGADFYELDVTSFVSNFSTFIPGYESHVVDGGGSIEEEVLGLTSGTAYRFRLRAVNSAGASVNSKTINVQTTGSTVELGLTVVVPDNGSFTSAAVNVTGTVINAVGVVTATMTYNKLTETEEHVKNIDVVDGSYSVEIDDSMLDEIGLKFSVTVKDEVGEEKTDGPKYVYRTFTSATSPNILSGSFAGDAGSIRIISIPYDINDDNIKSIFNPSLGEYNKKTWRLAHYQDGENVENETKLLKIDRGLGYWFNAKGNINPVKAGTGSVAKNDTENPFTMSLVPGWNQIGNPFPFAIDWSDVLEDNSASDVSALTIYSGDKRNFDAGNKIDVFGGGFVHADNATTLSLKVSLRSRADGGRIQHIGSDLGKDLWEVPLSLTQGASTYDIGGIGMNPLASEGKDQSDNMRLPRLDEFLDITFDHPKEHFRYFTKDVLPTSNEASWKFSVQSNGNGEDGMLQWDNSQFGSNIAKIFLLDIETLQMIDMRTTDRYAFNNPGRKEFAMYYDRDGKDIVPDIFGAGIPYPNPSSANVSIHVGLAPGQGDFNTELVVLDLMGRQVGTVQQTLPAGIHQLSWDGNDISGNRVQGLYLVRVRVNHAWLNQAHRVVMK